MMQMMMTSIIARLKRRANFTRETSYYYDTRHITQTHILQHLFRGHFEFGVCELCRVCMLFVYSFASEMRSRELPHRS